MNPSDWMVIIAGVAAMAWVNWYFFLADRGVATAAAVGGGAQEVTVVVRGGYTPGAVHVRKGTPVRLVFDRQETSGCSEEVVIPDFGIRRYLPANQKTAVELTPDRAGTYEFTCGMGMLRGQLTVEDEPRPEEGELLICQRRHTPLTAAPSPRRSPFRSRG
jgi:plastocyanin domain-containing protein